MGDEVWARDQIVAFHREMGAMGERQRSLEGSTQALRMDLRDGLDALKVSVRDDVQSASAHIRGELHRIDQALGEARRLSEADAETRRKAETAKIDRMVAALRAENQEAREAAEEAHKTNRRIMFAIVVLGAGAQQVFNHLSTILSFIGSH